MTAKIKTAWYRVAGADQFDGSLYSIYQCGKCGASIINAVDRYWTCDHGPKGKRRRKDLDSEVARHVAGWLDGAQLVEA